jgi:hypothetical protein
MTIAHRYLAAALLAIGVGIAMPACASYGNYPRGGYPSSYPTRGRYQSPAFDVGYRDGFQVGRDDSRDRESHDPVRSRYYRAADHGYDYRFGRRDEYKREYRAAFARGYADGYRRRWGR